MVRVSSCKLLTENKGGNSKRVRKTVNRNNYNPILHQLFFQASEMLRFNLVDYFHVSGFVPMSAISVKKPPEHRSIKILGQLNPTEN